MSGLPGRVTYSVHRLRRIPIHALTLLAGQLERDAPEPYAVRPIVDPIDAADIAISVEYVEVMLGRAAPRERRWCGNLPPFGGVLSSICEALQLLLQGFKFSHAQCGILEDTPELVRGPFMQIHPIKPDGFPQCIDVAL